MDYEVLQSTNADLNKAVVRVNIFREHRQTIQYIDPADHARLAQVRETKAIYQTTTVRDTLNHKCPLCVTHLLFHSYLGPYVMINSFG